MNDTEPLPRLERMGEEIGNIYELVETREILIEEQNEEIIKLKDKNEELEDLISDILKSNENLTTELDECKEDHSPRRD